MWREYDPFDDATMVAIPVCQSSFIDGPGPSGDGLLLLPDPSERRLMHSAFDYAGIMGISIRLLGPVCQQEVDEVWRLCV